MYTNSRVTGPRSGRISRNPFLNFLRDFRKTFRCIQVTELAKRAGQIWRKMNSRQKRPYCELAQQAPRRKPKAKKKRIVKRKRKKSKARKPRSKTRKPKSKKRTRSQMSFSSTDDNENHKICHKKEKTERRSPDEEPRRSDWVRDDGHDENCIEKGGDSQVVHRTRSRGSHRDINRQKSKEREKSREKSSDRHNINKDNAEDANDDDYVLE